MIGGRSVSSVERKITLQRSARSLQAPKTSRWSRKSLRGTNFLFFKSSKFQPTGIDSNLVTLKVESGNFIRFEIDTGARFITHAQVLRYYSLQDDVTLLPTFFGSPLQDFTADAWSYFYAWI